MLLVYKRKILLQHLQKCFELRNYILTKFNAFIMMGKSCIQASDINNQEGKQILCKI